MTKALGSAFQPGTEYDSTAQAKADRKTHLHMSLIEEKRYVEKYAKNFEKLAKGTVDVPGFIKAIAPELMRKMMVTLETTDNEKLKVQMIQDLLDRAGFGKIQKGAVLHQGVIDINATKMELVNTVLSLGKKAGVKVKEEAHVEGDEDIIDGDLAE